MAHKHPREDIQYGSLPAKKANTIISPVFMEFAEMIASIGWEQARANLEARYTNPKTLQTALSNIVKAYVTHIARISDEWMNQFRTILNEEKAGHAVNAAIFSGNDDKEVRHQIYKLFKMLASTNMPQDIKNFGMSRRMMKQLKKLGTPFQDAVLFGKTEGKLADQVNRINKERGLDLTSDTWLATDFALTKAFNRIRQFADMEGDIEQTWKHKLIFLLAMSGRRQEDMFDTTIRYHRTENGIDWFIQDHPSKQKGLTNTSVEFPILCGREVFERVLSEVQPYLMERYHAATDYNQVFNKLVKHIFIKNEDLATVSLAQKRTGHNLRSLYLQAAIRIVPHPSERDVVFGARILGDTVNVVANRYAGVSRPTMQIF